MLDQVYEALLEEKNNQKIYGYHCIVEVGGMKGFVFCNKYGGIHNNSTLNREIKHIVDDYNAQEQIKAIREYREPLLIHGDDHCFTRHLDEMANSIKDYLNKISTHLLTVLTISVIT